MEVPWQKIKKALSYNDLTFFTKNARRVLVDVVFLLLHRRWLYFRVVPSFQQVRYNEQWISRLFLRHSDHEWLCEFRNSSLIPWCLRVSYHKEEFYITALYHNHQDKASSVKWLNIHDGSVPAAKLIQAPKVDPTKQGN